MKISPRLCCIYSERLVPEMLPIAFSLGPHADPGSSICAAGRALGPQRSPCPSVLHPLKAAAVIWMVFLPPGLAWTSSVLSLPPRVPVGFQTCTTRHCLDSEPHAQRATGGDQGTNVSCRHVSMFTSLYVHPFKAQPCPCLQAL